MDIFSFAVPITDEKSCRLHFKEQRHKQGVVCNRCGSLDHYWLSNKLAYQGKSCEARQTLKSDTIQENSSPYFIIWYKNYMSYDYYQEKVLQ